MSRRGRDSLFCGVGKCRVSHTPQAANQQLKFLTFRFASGTDAEKATESNRVLCQQIVQGGTSMNLCKNQYIMLN